MYMYGTCTCTFTEECLHVVSRERIPKYGEGADEASKVGHLSPLLLDVCHRSDDKGRTERRGVRVI